MMLHWLIAVSILCAVLVVLLSFSVFYLLRFAKTVLNIQDAVEEALDILDRSYKTVAEVLEIPVGSDDPFVIKVVTAIKEAHHSILVVAHKLSDEWRQEEKKT